MNIIPNTVELRKGGLGYIVKGQKGEWHGSLPPERESGDITGFSSKSRRRLREMLATAQPLNDEWKPFGLCFTIPGRILSPDEVRHLWHDWVLLFRKYFELPMIWRIELQQRKQAHWHCIIWAHDTPQQPAVAVLTYDLALMYRRLVRRLFGPFNRRTDIGFDEHGVDIQSLDGSQATAIVGYLADHASKHKQSQLGWQGRQWGIVNRHLLTFETEPVCEVTERQHTIAARQYRRLQERLRARGGAYTGVRVTPSGNVSKSIFGRDALRLEACYQCAVANS